MTMTKLPKPETVTGRVVSRAVRELRPRTAVGKIAAALETEIGGAAGDAAQQAFADSGWKRARDTSGERSRRARRAAYAAEALREQQEAGRRAEEAYRRAYEQARRQGEARGTAGARASQEARRAAGPSAGGPRRASPRGPHSEPRNGPRTYRYKGRVVINYYEVLGVGPKDEKAVIDKSYRTLIKAHHPDQGGDARKAQLLNEAYAVLRNSGSRQRYDRENGFG